MTDHELTDQVSAWATSEVMRDRMLRWLSTSGEDALKNLAQKHLIQAGAGGFEWDQVGADIGFNNSRAAIQNNVDWDTVIAQVRAHEPPPPPEREVRGYHQIRLTWYAEDLTARTDREAYEKLRAEAISAFKTVPGLVGRLRDIGFEVDLDGETSCGLVD